MLIRFFILAALYAIFISACSKTSSSEKRSFFDEEFSQNLIKIDVFIAGYQTHVEEVTTEIVDREPSATLSLNCAASCYQDNIQKIDETLASARSIECYPTFFMQKYVLQSTGETVVFYLDFDGRQIKLAEQCYQLDSEYDIKVDALGMMTWEKRRR